ncbi:MAG: succinate dehydrogenase, cytochrome b556 subunit [Sideroxydans sp.]|nr:succinate dehydrogenase, cytochrome b556 subunit [Sideroxydans sp.]
MINNKRPRFLALHQIKLPLPGIISILHRISGALLFLTLPLLLWMLQYSLRSIVTYTQLTDALRTPFSKIFLLVILWAFLHHFCAGIRYLAIDLHLASSLARSRSSSKWVLAVSLALTASIGIWLW